MTFDPNSILESVDVQAKFQELTDNLEEFLNKLPDGERLDVSMTICASMLFNSILHEFERNKDPLTPYALGHSCQTAVHSFSAHMVSGIKKVFL